MKEDHEQELNRAYKLGQSAGLDSAARILGEAAQEVFLRDDDVKATLLRGYCKKIEALANKVKPPERMG